MTTSFILACCCFWIEIQVKIIKETMDQQRERNDDSKLTKNIKRERKSERMSKKIEPVDEPNKEGTPEKTQVKA